MRNPDPKWRPLDINELIPVAKNYLQETLLFRSDNRDYMTKKKEHSKEKESSDKTDKDSKKSTSKKSKSSQKTSSSDDGAKKFQLSQDPAEKERRLQISRAIHGGTFKFSDFTSQVPKNHCIWHGSHHSTDRCKSIPYFLSTASIDTNETMEQYKASSSSKIPNPPVAKHTTTSLHPPTSSSTHLNDALEVIDDFTSSLNDNNDKSDPYYIASPHTYCRLAAVIDSPSTSPSSQHTSAHMVIDSGAWPHMCNDESLFTSMRPWSTLYPS